MGRVRRLLARADPAVMGEKGESVANNQITGSPGEIPGNESMPALRKKILASALPRKTFPIMKTVGIIGGLGPPSTAEYYKSIMAKARAKYPEAGNPHIIIDSIDIFTMVGFLKRKDLPGLRVFLGESFKKLEMAGVDFALMACNTTHVIFDELQSDTKLPLISIVEATFKKVQSMGLKKLALLGTEYTMNQYFYEKVFEAGGIKLITPEPDERKYINDKIFAELEKGIFTPQTKEGYLKIIERMRKDYDVRGVLLACTEFPLLLQDGDSSIPFFDTTQLHVDAVVETLR